MPRNGMLRIVIKMALRSHRNGGSDLKTMLMAAHWLPKDSNRRMDSIFGEVA